ncbi:MAG: threonylcarbamoyl-AMP synthase [Deltaproteobacteria bacterium]|nr:threonylcarbamoyl-AMP synthase [Deltaproteobacteria bacterium]
MGYVRLDIHPEHPQPRKVQRVIDVLHGGGVAAYPTDSVYGLGCAIESRKAVAALYRAKQLSPKQGLALLVPSLSAASEYGRFTRGAYRLAKRIFPGPFVLVVPATSEVPRNLLDKKRRTVGLRISSHPIVQAIVEGLGRPVLTTTAQLPGEAEPLNDPDDVGESFGHVIDVLVDGGNTGLLPTTVLEVDPSAETHVNVLREGCGSLEGLWVND